MPKFNLVLLIHAHQPVGNFDEVMEHTYVRCYSPFVECLARHPQVRMGIHYSGPLFEWLLEHHPEYFELVGSLVARGQVEMVGGGFYEPILIAIPPEDQQEQIHRLSDFIAEHFQQRPRGAWLAERVWEPSLPAVLAEAGVDYTLVDDSHFLTAGHELSKLFGYFIAEDRGRTVKVIPGLQRLRYLLPFGSPEDCVAFLRGAAGEQPGGMASMGDDMEKFGAWPHTYDHCYRDGWLDRFFSMMEANHDWLDLATPSEALAARPPLGRADLPTASYTEMMEWVLPTAARQQFHSLREEFANRPDVERFLRGGFWRGFFSKYAESNLLHKKMLRVSSKLRPGRKKPGKTTLKRGRSITQLLRAQCNDAYWHGVFGGLYSPHLRTALWRELVSAETEADAAIQKVAKYQVAERLDFDADGREEIEVTSPGFAALLKPSGGGTLEVLDFRPSSVTLINSLQRRLEAYHARLGAGTMATDRVASIHDQVIVKEEGLEKRLRYDRWPRHTFRLLLFPIGKTLADYEAISLGESAAFAGGDYQVAQVTPQEVKFALESSLSDIIPGERPGDWVRAEKTFKFAWNEKGSEIACAIELARSSPEANATPPYEPVQFAVGLEIVLNLLAPNVSDRYFEFPENRHPLAWSGVVGGSQLRVVDEWQDVAVGIDAPGASHLWVAPIETVSDSDQGFERVYQGSQILAVWNAEITPGGRWNVGTTLRLSKARQKT